MREAVLCPAADEYRRLACGQAPPIGAERLLAHLEACEGCARLVGTLPEPYTLVDLIRQAGTVEDWASSAAVVQLIDELSRLRPDAPAAQNSDQPEQMLTQSPSEAAEAHSTELYDWLAAPQVEGELGRLGPYRVLQVIGVGGMGIVFRAQDPHLDRIVALKAMLPTRASREGARQRFLREARATAAIKHDHIVSVYQVGEDRGVPFLAMEFLEGEPLDVRLEREGKLPAGEVLRIGREIAMGLAAAHKRDLIHRDIKPANVWLEAETNRVKILDFGLARATGEECRLTHEGALVGTPEYMSPEQGQGRGVDHRCDLFSLGCVLYRMVTGEAPFRGTDIVSTLLAGSTHTPLSPSEVEATVPPALSDLIMDLLAKAAADRPSSAQVVAESLEQIARQPAPKLAAAKPATRRRWPVPIGIAVCLFLMGLAILGAGGAFRLKTKDGTIVLEGLPADAEVLVDGQTAKVKYGPDGKWIEIEAAPGERLLQIKAAGFKAKTQDVTLSSSDRKPIRIYLEPLTAAAKPTATEAEAGPLPSRLRNELGMEFALVSKGKAWLGGGRGKVGDREIEFKDDFYLGVYEVTQEEWEQIMGSNPSHFSRDGAGKDAVKDITDEELKRFPVDNVSWDDCRQLVAGLNAKLKESGWMYRLPTQMEWEYACRGGPLGMKDDYRFDFYLGGPTNTLPSDQANFDGAGLNRPRMVGSYLANRLGLYDMHGNAWELCDDVLPTDGVASRAMRGGGWNFDATYCRAANHFATGQASRANAHGLRLVRVPVK